MFTARGLPVALRCRPLAETLDSERLYLMIHFWLAELLAVCTSTFEPLMPNAKLLFAATVIMYSWSLPVGVISHF